MPADEDQPPSHAALPTLATLTATVEKLVAALGDPGANHSNELLQGLLHLDALLEDWLAAAEATNLVSMAVFAPLDELPPGERSAVLGSLVQTVTLQSYRAGNLLHIIDPEASYRFEMVPYVEDDAGHVGVVPEKSAQVMRLFEIYAPDEVSTFRQLVTSRAHALETLVDDVAAGMLGSPEVRATALQSSFRDLASAREALRTYIRTTFPLSPAPAATYNVHVSGGVVGVVGDNGTANLEPQLAQAAHRREEYHTWVRKYLEDEGRDPEQAPALADEALREGWESMSPNAPRS